MSKTWIGVLDCNNFFVSCERLFRPDLHGKPVVVLSSNDGCVISRSQEVKDMNVPMGVPYFKVKDILNKAGTTTFSSHFALYRDISMRVFSVMREELDRIEQYSIDEAFFELTRDPYETALGLKKVVERKVGVPVSVGISSTKTRAKYASHEAKQKKGLFVADDDTWSSISGDILLSQIWGVGGKLEIKFKQHNLITVHDLMSADRSRIRQVFGVTGVRVFEELRGNRVFNISTKLEPQKSIMSSKSFKKATSNKQILEDSIAYHLRHIVADLRVMKMKAGIIQISIRPNRYGDFMLRGGSQESTLTTPTDNTIELLAVAKDLLRQLYEDNVPYQKVGVVLSGFVLVKQEQHDLFGILKKKNLKSLMSAVDAINSKQSKELILFGSRLLTSEWESKMKSTSPGYTTSWSDIIAVKAK